MMTTLVGQCSLSMVGDCKIMWRNGESNWIAGVGLSCGSRVGGGAVWCALPSGKGSRPSGDEREKEQDSRPIDTAKEGDAPACVPLSSHSSFLVFGSGLVLSSPPRRSISIPSEIVRQVNIHLNLQFRALPFISRVRGTSVYLYQSKWLRR